MKNLIFSLFAITLAGVAAVAATTAMLNSPVHNIGPPPSDKKTDGTTPGAPPTGTPPTGKPAPTSIPDADKPLPGGASTPAPAPAPAPTPGAADGAKPAADAGSTEEGKEDKDPYEGIAPEDLPPDLQYDADSSVSFPTNT